MKKRLLILMLVLVMALCAFVSCGDEEEPDESTGSSSSGSASTDSSKPAGSKPPVISGGDEDCEHTWTTTSKTESTCKTEGVEKFKCSKCSATKEETIPLSKVHSYDKDTIVEIEPTCQADGKIIKTCKLCGDVEESKGKEKVKHQPVETVVVEPTCDKDGVKKNVCSMCGTEIIVVGFNPVIPKLGHSYEKAENILAAEGVTLVEGDCENEGYFQVVCTVCATEGDRITRDQYAEMATNPEYKDEIYIKMKKSGHNYAEFVQQVPATCDTDGYTEYKCTRCDSTEKKAPTKAPGHLYDKSATAVENEHYVIITPATCLTEGKKAYICKVCKAQATDDKGTETIPMLNHDTSNHSPEYLVKTAEATCKLQAYKEYKCCVTAACTKTEIVYEGELRQHNLVKNGEPSCKTLGYTPAKCSYEDCDYTTDRHPDIPAVAIKHSMGEVIAVATCISDAKYMCEYCGTEYGPYADDDNYKDGFATGIHKFESEEIVPPTCSSVGYKVYLCTGDAACTAERRNPNMDEEDVSKPEDITPRTPHNFDIDGNGIMDVSPDGRIVCAQCAKQYRDVTTEVSSGNGKLCLGCGSETVADCTCGLDVIWNGYVSPSIPDEHNLASNVETVISSVTWKEVENTEKQPLVMGNGIIRIKGEADDATYTIKIYDKENGTLLNTLTKTGREVFIDLYEYAEVGQIAITSTTGAMVFFYSAL